MELVVVVVVVGPSLEAAEIDTLSVSAFVVSFWAQTAFHPG